MVGENKVVKNLNKIIKARHCQDIPIKIKQKGEFTHGMQLTWNYWEHWSEIKDTFKQRKTNLNEHGPIMTMQFLKQIRCANELTKELLNKEHIRKMAAKDVAPTEIIYENEINSNIFKSVLRVIPQFCLALGMKRLEELLLNGNSDECLEKILNISGTILDTENEIEEYVDEMVEMVEPLKMEVEKNE
jgi:hypothetical protein